MKAEIFKTIFVILVGFAFGAVISLLPDAMQTDGTQYAFLGGLGIFTTISGAAKNLFSGAAQAARQERKEVKKAAKQTAKETKEAAKKAIEGGGVSGAVVGAWYAKIVDFVKKNWLPLLAGLGVIIGLWYFFLRKGKRGGVRRRSGGAGSSAMKARMAKVRAARRRKK